MMLRTRCAFVVAMALAGSASCGSDNVTEPSILTIEAGIPTGWVLVGGRQATYVVGTDTHAHSGRYALSIGGTDTSVLRFNGVGQYLRADPYRGKRLRLRAWVRQIGIRGSDVGLWLRIDGPGVMQGFDNFSSRPLLGTADWHQVESILDVPRDALEILFGALMSGKGTFLVDDMTLDVIPATGPTTNQLLGYHDLGVDSLTVANAAAGRPTVPTNLNFESK